MKLQKGNVFTHICDSVHAGRGSLSGGSLSSGVSAFLSVDSSSEFHTLLDIKAADDVFTHYALLISIWLIKHTRTLSEF